MAGSTEISGRRRSLFRPCIDLHEGKVKQIVGGTLDLQTAASSSTGPYSSPSALRTNFISESVLPFI